MSFQSEGLDDYSEEGYEHIFAKCGFNRNTARVILFGPACLGGAFFRHLYSEQGVGQIQVMLKHWRTSTTQAGRLIRIAVHWSQFAVGTGTPLLKDVSTKLSQMEVKWFASLRQYLQHIGGSIELDDPGTPPIQRVNDAYIMDVVLARGQFKPAQIRQINYCRMYLQAVTISDITRANAMQLDMPMRRGQPSSQSSTSRWHRFNQARPPQTAWTLWKKACLLWSNTTGTARDVAVPCK
jgi:hypothetical protein